MGVLPFEELLSVHVRYELDMLFGTYERLERPISDVVSGNALIESFCLHARQLLDFFDNTQGLHASEFTTSEYTPLSSAVLGVDEALAQKLNTQIAHLTKRRATESADKIGIEERTQLRNGLERALRHFEAHLRPPFSARWGTYPPLTGLGTTQLSATNAVTIISTAQSTSTSPPNMANSIAVNPTVSGG